MAKQTAPKTKDRSPDNTTVTIAMPKSLLLAVDACAAEEQRNRSNYIVYYLSQAVKKTLMASRENSPDGGSGLKPAKVS